MTGLNVEVRLGDVRFLINTPGDISLFYPDELYQTFFSQGLVPDSQQSDSIELDLAFGPLPDLGKVETLFEGGQLWASMRMESEIILCFGLGNAGGPNMTARFSPECKKIALSCTADFLKGEGHAENPLRYPVDQLLLLHSLLTRKGAIIHAAGFAVQEKAYIFPGYSRAGKSTLSRNLLQKSGMHGLSDDRIIVREIQGSFLAFGTPWPGDAMIATNASAPLYGIFFLEKSNENRIEPISQAEAFRRFMPVASILWYDAEAVERSFSFLEKLTSTTPSYVFRCTPDLRAADCFEEFVNER